jgi:ketosteroid isomerase-like protein
MMRNTALAIGFLTLLVTPAAAQKVEIEAANVKWMEFFNKGNFDGAASLYTVDATAFPPGSSVVKGRVAIAAMWKSMAEHVSDPKLTTLDVKRLGPSAAREIGALSLKTKGLIPKEITGKYVVVWEKIGREWKLATDIWNDDTRNGISHRGSNEASGDSLFDSFKRHKPR